MCLFHVVVLWTFVNSSKEINKKLERTLTQPSHSLPLLLKFAYFNSLKPNKRQNNEQPNEQKNKWNAQLHKKAAESAENISGMKGNQNI